MKNNKDTNDKQSRCDCCNEDIPPSAALTTEGKDYIYHFCGMQCYDLWKKTNSNDEKKK